MEYQVRDKIDGQYRVTEKHLGGMSIVYLVLDEFSQRRFAVKTLKEDLLLDRDAKQRFSEEARTWMNLGRHPNIVEAIIYREMEGQPFLFLEYVEGTNLQSLIDQEKTIYLPQLIEFMSQVAEGLSYVHNVRIGSSDSGVIHRDVKPANVMLTKQAVAKITDFGLAKIQGSPGQAADIGVGVGTYLYMPPEQVLDASTADRTSDIYAFGVAFYLALTGQYPIRGGNVGQLVRNILSQEPMRPSQLVRGVPEELERLVLKCLAKARHERYQSFDEIVAAFPAVRETVEQTYSINKTVYHCHVCGYQTVHKHVSCPLCAGQMSKEGQGAPPVLPVALPAEAQPAAPADAAINNLAPEASAALQLLEAARNWRAQGEIQRCINLLRQALMIQPDDPVIRRELDAATLQAARLKPRASGKTFNWPMFRGNITRSGYTPEVILPPLTRSWQYRVGEWILASPVVANGLVYVGGRLSRPALQGHFVALKATTGELVWEMDFPHEVLLSATVLGGNHLFLAVDNYLAAIAPQSGKRLWEVTTHSPIATAPTAWQNAVYFGTAEGVMHCVQAQSGQLNWTFRAEAAIYSSAVVWENCVYFGSGDSKVYAVDQATGVPVWEFVAAGEIMGTPTVHRGRVYVGSTDSRLYCLNSANGRRLWEFQTGGAVNSSPAIGQDAVYIGSRDRNIYAVEAETGRKKWHFAAQDWCDASPAVSGRTVFTGCHDGRLYAIEAETGLLLWEYATEGEISSSPAISGGRLFVGSNDGNLYSFRSA